MFKKILKNIVEEVKDFSEEAKEHLFTKEVMDFDVKKIDKKKIENEAKKLKKYFNNTDENKIFLREKIIEKIEDWIVINNDLKKPEKIEFSSLFFNSINELEHEIENDFLEEFLSENDEYKSFLLIEQLFNKYDVLTLKEIYVTNNIKLLENLSLNDSNKINELKEKMSKNKIFIINNKELLMLMDNLIYLSENNIEDKLKNAFKLSIIKLSIENNYYWFYFDIVYRLNDKEEELNNLLELYPIFNLDFIDLFSNNDYISKNVDFYKYREFLNDSIMDKDKSFFN